MGCRCNERRAALANATRAAMRGDVAGALNSMQFVKRTMIEDAHAQALRADAIRQSAQARLAGLRRAMGRR